MPDTRNCPECGRPMSKVCPLGMEVGGFIWQCLVCKTVVADWAPIKPQSAQNDDRDGQGGGTD